MKIGSCFPKLLSCDLCNFENGVKQDMLEHKRYNTFFVSFCLTYYCFINIQGVHSTNNVNSKSSRYWYTIYGFLNKYSKINHSNFFLFSITRKFIVPFSRNHLVKCTYCPFLTKHKNISRHEESCKKKTFVCNQCSVRCFSKIALTRHIQRKH